MKVKSMLLAAAAVVTAMGLGQVAQAREGGGAIRIEKRGDRERKPSRYIVAQILNVDGTMSFQAIGSNQLNERRKELRELYEEALKEWKTDALRAKKEKEKFTEKPPTKPDIARCRYAPKTYKTEEEARAMAEKIQERWDEKMAKKRGEKDTEADDEKKVQKDHKKVEKD
jgi:hypothetical protein